jgi:xanthine dehydrogenase accessory factor
MSPDKKLSVWRLALSSLNRNIPVILLYVLESKGSSPGRRGFLMTINAIGEMEGSIGGGIMEHKFTELAKERLRQNEPILAIKRQVHDKEAFKDQSGMICSGEQTNLLYSLQPSDKPTLGKIILSLEQHRHGCLNLSPDGIAFDEQPPASDFSFQRSSETHWQYREKTGFSNRLFIIGGGHVALAFSRIMRTMDFYIVLFDDRQTLDSLTRNDYVHERILLHDYRELSGWIQAGETHYVAVMTQGYRTDDQVVRTLLPLDFRYFGLLGSKAKVEKMLTDYRAEGITEERLQRLSAPAGLAIRSQTPEEIAISIAAEIIQRLPREEKPLKR